MSDELRDLLNRAARGDTPTHTDIAAVSLSGSLAERKRTRTELSNEVQRLARYAGSGDESVPQRVEDLVNRFGGGSGAETPTDAVKDLPRTYGSVGHRTAHQSAPDHTPLRAMGSALRHVALTKTALSDAELAALPVNPSLSAAAALKWRSDVLTASMRVAEISGSGHHADAIQAASEAAGPLSGGLKFAEPVDHSEAARLPDGSYDPAALVANIRR